MLKSSELIKKVPKKIGNSQWGVPYLKRYALGAYILGTPLPHGKYGDTILSFFNVYKT